MIEAYVFVLGLAFGSFALAMADRMRLKKDWVRARSQCDYCKKTLQPRDLVPVFSWLSSLGRCRYCQHKLSAFYPLVEIALGLIFLLSYVAYPFVLSGLGIVLFVLWCLCLVLGTALFVYDLRWFLLPNKLAYPLIAVSLLHRIVYGLYIGVGFGNFMLQLMFSLLVGSGIFWLLFQISRGKWIGYGDVRLGLSIGLLLPTGFVVWLAICAASVMGLLFALPQLPKKKKKLQLKIPFGPFLLLGLVFAYLYGTQLIDWYSKSFLYL